MAPDMRRWLLDEAPNAVVATIGPSGRPQLTPNWFLWDGDVFWVSTGVETVKVRNLRRDSRITLCIDRSEPPETYVQITGTAEIIETELMLADLDSLERRTEDLIKKARGLDKDAEAELDLAGRLLEDLRAGNPARAADDQP